MIDFGNCDILGFQRESNFLGEDVLRYKNTNRLSIQGNLLALTASSGISGIVSGAQALELSANNWSQVILRGVSFGSGIITSINFDDNTDLRKQRYTVDLEIFDSGDIRNFPTNSVYSGISYSNFRYITDLSEKISYNSDFESQNYTHSISVGILTSNSGISMQMAKELAANLFDSQNILNVLGNYPGLSGKKAIYSEDYDQFNVRCDFEKRVKLYNETSGNYTINKIYDYKRGTDGVITVSEKGNIIALAEPYIDVLSDAFQIASGLCFDYCQEVFNAYEDGDNYVLEDIAITKGTSINRFARTLDYEFVFSNNLNISNGFFWNYTHDSNLSDKGLIESKENGEIVGFGHIVDTKFAAAKLGYNSIKSQIIDRTEGAYDRFRSFNSDFTNTDLFLIGKEENFSPYNGRINYTWSYNNDQNMLSTPPELTRAQIVVSEGFRVPIAQAFNIINVGEIEQVSDADEVAQKSIEININGKKTATLNDYLDYVYTVAPTYAGNFLTNVSYNYDPFSNSFSATITWGVVYE